MNPAEVPVFTAAQQARWLRLATLIEEKPRFTVQTVAEQIAAALNAGGYACRVDLEPHFVTPDEIRLGPLATVTMLDDDGQPMGYPNDAIWAADLEGKTPATPASRIEDVTGTTAAEPDVVAQLTAERDEADRRAGAAERKLAALEESERKTQFWLAEQKRRRGYGPHVSFDRVWSDTCAKADAPTGAGDLQPHEVERLWRATGLPEYFLGNGGSNTGLYAFAKALRNAKGPE